MKKFLALLLSSVMVLGLAACGSSATTAATTAESKEETTEETTAAPSGASYDITVWVSEVEGMKELTEKQIAAFAEANGVTINATVEGISEADSATQMLTSVEDGADIFCFAQDQLARLVQAGALAKLGEKAKAEVTELNSENSVACSTINDDIYCYPLTDDNGYFMFYDKSVIPEEDAGSLSKILEDCEKAGKNFSFQVLTSGWYSAGFFFATGCVSEWETDDEGNFTAFNDTFNSDEGIIALRGMQQIFTSSAYTQSEAGTADFSAAVPSAAVISGTWDVNTAKEALGDNYAVAKLPTFEVDGKEYQIGSFSGCKLMGVKPQVDAEKASVLQKLALYLTGKDCQLERFTEFGWGPSNKEAQSSSEVQSDEALCALAEQNAYAVPQGNIPGSWWNIAKSYAAAALEAEQDDEDALKAALDDYQAAIEAILSLDTSGYIFVGAWNGWDNSDGNYKMELLDGSDSIYYITVDVEESDYMGGRIVMPGDWGTDLGLAQVVSGNELISEDGGDDNNIVFLAPGTYKVELDASAGEITITAE